MFLTEPPATPADLNWRLFGLPVRISPLFWIGAVLLGWSASGGDFDVLLVWVACVLVSVIVHELGHALAARAFGVRDGRIVLYHMGGLAISPSGTVRRWRKIVELLCGPGAGFVLAGVVWLLATYALDVKSMSFLAQNAVAFLITIGVMWGLLNLLPVYPLDGGQIAQELIVWRRPNDGLLLSMRFAVGAAAVVSAGALALWFAGWSTGFLAVLFALIGVQNYL